MINTKINKLKTENLIMEEFYFEDSDWDKFCKEMYAASKKCKLFQESLRQEIEDGWLEICVINNVDKL